MIPTVANNKTLELKARTKTFALRIIRMFQALPHRSDAYVLGKQVLRSGTSIAANYRATCRARSRAEFVARIGIVAEEADETVLWLELLGESGIMESARLEPLLEEARELSAIFTASQNTVTRRG